jgi:hypothetical protein
MITNNAAFQRLVALRGPIADLPAFGATGYPAGHVFINEHTGDVYENIGGLEYSLHVCPGVNRHVFDDNFRLRPGINANKAVPAGDTYNTAQMQLSLDKSPDWELLGANMTSALCTFADGGGITLTTAGAATDAAILLPHLDTGLTPFTAAKWNTNDEISFETTIKTDALIADETLWAGFKLTNTPVTATDDDQCFFRFIAGTNSGKWQVIDSNTGTDNAQDSGVTVAASTVYKLKLIVDGARVPRYFINDAFVKKGSALKADVDLIPYIGLLSDTSATAKAVTVRRVRIGKSFND